MAQITASSNIANGNIIQPTDILPLYAAMTSGGGYSVSLSGSITGSASTATTATTATSASNITTVITGGGTHYLTFVDQVGTRPAKLASLLEYNATTNSLQVTASRAITASYALNVATPSSTVNVIPSGSSSKPMYPIAGFAPFGGPPPTTASISINQFAGTPTPTALGTDIWVTANADQDPIPSISVTYVSPNLIFYSSDASYAGNVVFTGYIQQ
jgi:hypothetical protein